MNRITYFFLLAALFNIQTIVGQQQKINWLTNFDQAVKQAQAEKKPVLLFFHGSDWCPPCMKMQKEVFASEEFIEFSISKLVFLDVDFPYKNKLSDEQLAHNNELKKKFGLPDEFTQGYPQVVIINSKGKVLYQEKGYNGEGPQKLMDKVAEACK